jgi:hypothetical protein
MDMRLLTLLSAATTIVAAMFFGSGLAHATPGDGCAGNTYFDPNRWHCEPINTPSPPPRQFPPCNSVDPRFCPGLWN